MEIIGWHELLTIYIGQHYAGKNVLVVYLDDIESEEGYHTLLQDLDAIGFKLPCQFRCNGYLVIEMPPMLAKKFVDNHYKCGVRMERFDSDGVCMDVNW